MMTQWKTAPVRFLGIQEGIDLMPDFALYNILQPFADFTGDSTVAKRSILVKGYEIPAEEQEREDRAWHEFKQKKAGLVPATV